MMKDADCQIILGNLLRFTAEDIFEGIDPVHIDYLEMPNDPILKQQLKELAHAFSLFADPQTMTNHTDGKPRNTKELALNMVRIFGPNGYFAQKTQENAANACLFFYNNEEKLLAYGVIDTATEPFALRGQGEFALVSSHSYEGTAIADFMIHYYAPHLARHSEWNIFNGDHSLTNLFSTVSFHDKAKLQKLLDLGFENYPLPLDAQEFEFLESTDPQEIEKEVISRLAERFKTKESIINIPFKLKLLNIEGSLKEEFSGVIKKWNTARTGVLNLKALLIREVDPTENVDVDLDWIDLQLDISKIF
jgi:hypothetical protein